MMWHARLPNAPHVHAWAAMHAAMRARMHSEPAKWLH